jgi:hypothetical protein
MGQQPVGTLRPDRSEEGHPQASITNDLAQHAAQDTGLQAPRSTRANLILEAQSARITVDHSRVTSAVAAADAADADDAALEATCGSATVHLGSLQPSRSIDAAAEAAVDAISTAMGTTQAAESSDKIHRVTASELARIEAAARTAKEAVAAVVREVEIQSRDPHTDDRNHWHAAGHNTQRFHRRVAQPLVLPQSAPRPRQHLGTGSASGGERQHVNSNVVPGRAPSVRNNIIPGQALRKKMSTSAVDLWQTASDEQRQQCGAR